MANKKYPVGSTIYSNNPAKGWNGVPLTVIDDRYPLPDMVRVINPKGEIGIILYKEIVPALN